MNLFKRNNYGPLSFWMLNHRLKHPELLRQMDELKKRGFSGFFMHPRAGLLTPYGSKEWFDAIGFCIQHAKKIGLEAWLYDDDPFPSGVAGGRVTLDHPEFRASYLRSATLDVEAPGAYELDLPAGALVAAFIVCNGKITRVDEYAGLVRTDWTSALALSSYYPPYSAEGSPHWRANAVSPHYRISLDMKRAPAMLVGFTRHYHVQSPWGEFTDLLNPKAVAYFVELTHKEYHRRFGKEFGKTIPGIFTDEPKVFGSLPWSESLEPHFRSITGRGLVESLPHLTREINGDSANLRWAYREAISRAFKAAFVDQIGSYCSSVKLSFTGHISPEEDPIGQAYMAPGLMDWIGDMTIPSTDIIGVDVGDARHPLLHLGPKLASSAAHTRGKTHVMCEAFAVVDWLQDTSFLGKATNWLYALGVNMLTVHGQFYSIDGLRKREAPPSQFIQASYWEHFNAFSRYVENLSRELTAGRHDAPLAIYYPNEAFMALTSACDHWELPHESPPNEARQLRDLLAEMMHLLLPAGYDFDLVDASALMAAEIADGKIKIATETYSALVLPGGWIRKDASEVLCKLEDGGVPVLSLQDRMPILGGGFYCARSATKLSVVLRDLAKHGRPIFHAEGRLLGHKRVSSDGVCLFLVNNADSKFHGNVTPDFAGPYEIFDLQTGRTFAAPEPLQLEIEPGRGALIRQRRTTTTVAAYRNASDWQPWLDLSTGWTARAESDNCLVLNEFRMRADEAPRPIANDEFISAPFVDLLASEAHLAAQYLGRVTYFWTSFECRSYDRSLHLVRDSQLGPPADRERSDSFRFFVNGQEVEAFQPCHRYDPCNLQVRIDGLIRDGRNFLVMEQTLPGNWPLDKGMPYDCVRLFGDFHVELPYGNSMPAFLSPRPATYEIGTPISLHQVGHPHYGGIVVYSRNVGLAEIPERLALRFHKLHESAEVVINGKPAGILWQEPHLLEIVDSPWRVGENRIEVRCSTSPANYLQAILRPSGMAGVVTLCR